MLPKILVLTRTSTRCKERPQDDSVPLEQQKDGIIDWVSCGEDGRPPPWAAYPANDAGACTRLGC